MKFYKKLYISDSIRKSAMQIKYSLKFHPFRKNYYIISLSESNDLFDIISSRYLIQPYYKKHTIFVIGVAKNKDDAIILVQRIIEELLPSYTFAEIKEHFLK